ncbi:MAG: OprO/OprP family phosphate-selective porin [Candidatus Polarisedimenticolaceae bacterium]|nr:OprO/OprP family phosphate-selective porin [Candidatus Polarisedimenticolaceae bacterium]
MKNRITIMGLALISTTCFTAANAAGITVHEEGEKYVKIGGRIQIQYHQISPDQGSDTDKIFFRRFRPFIIGSLHKNWEGKLQWDMGKAGDDNELSVKTAYMMYKGLSSGKIYVGNVKTGYSRETMTSSKKTQLVERSFVGDHNYGAPEYMLGLRFNGHTEDKRISYILSFGGMNLDPDNKKLDFDTPVNNDEDWNEGWVVGGRVDFHPFGYLKRSQGDFKREQKATIGLGAFSWSNDGDNNTFTDAAGNHMGGSKVDVDRANGIEISTAYRNAGFSVDAQYNLIKASTVDNSYTGGLFKDGDATLRQMALEGGYMVIPSTLELVAGFQSMDADEYDKAWTRNSVGVNWFLHKQDIKAQLSYRQGSNLDGVDGKDQDELFLQTQYVF